jgi:hypothetical protein
LRAAREAEKDNRDARKAELKAKIKEWKAAAADEGDGAAGSNTTTMGASDTAAVAAGCSASGTELCTESTPRFDAGDPAMPMYLDEHGYVVVKGVASADEVEVAKDLFWQYCEASSAMRRGQPETWEDEPDQERFLADPENGIISGAFCHSEAAWFARTRPKVREAFAAVWTAAAAADE